MNTIIVIGNGFDLQCGLNSKFQTFLEYRETMQVRNFWEIWLNYNKNNIENWCDVEEQIKQTLITNKVFSTYTIGELIAQEYSHAVSKYCSDDGFISSVDADKLSKVLHRCYQSTKSTQELLPFLYEQLNQFEYYFANYLSDQLYDNKHYNEKSTILLMKLLSITADDDLNNHHAYLLNFNYTEPKFREMEGIYTYNNVHGTLKNNNIIIGVDEHSHQAKKQKLLSGAINHRLRRSCR